MNAAQHAEETIGRCVALVVYCNHLSQARSVPKAIRAELDSVGDDIRRSGLDSAAIGRGILDELLHQFEGGDATRLHGEAVMAFGLTAIVAAAGA